MKNKENWKSCFFDISNWKCIWKFCCEKQKLWQKFAYPNGRWMHRHFFKLDVDPTSALTWLHSHTNNNALKSSFTAGGPRIALIQTVWFRYSTINLLVPSIRFYSDISAILRNRVIQTAWFQKGPKNFRTHFYTIRGPPVPSKCNMQKGH